MGDRIKMKHFGQLAIFLSVAITGLPVLAQDRNDVAALQYALAQHDLYSGTVDGRSGKGTQAAIKAFADKQGIESDFWPVASKMSVNTFWEAAWTDAADQAVLQAMEVSLFDAGSAKIDERILFRTDDGASACVKVNAKNTYGAYTGYRWLYFALVEVNHPKSSLLKLEDTAFAVGPAEVSDETAQAWCMLGFVRPK